MSLYGSQYHNYVIRHVSLTTILHLPLAYNLLWNYINIVGSQIQKNMEQSNMLAQCIKLDNLSPSRKLR